MVGKTGFEPATLCSQSRCATKLRYFPNGAPDKNRTRNLQIRSLTLYPIELRARNAHIIYRINRIIYKHLLNNMEVPIGIEPTLIELQSIALPLG
jgi:hypothetical protein